MELERLEKPTQIFRYCKISQNSIIELLSESVWFSHPSKFNDPYEDRIMEELIYQIDEKLGKVKEAEDKLRIVLTEEAKEEFNKMNLLANSEENNGLVEFNYENVKNIFAETIKEFEKNKKEIRENSKDLSELVVLACFTEHDDNLLMWAHYADKHTGICIEYDTKYECFEGLRYVNYENIYPGDVMTTDGKSLEDYYSYKSDEWIYENEWRIIKAHEKEGLRSFKKSIKRIVFGIKTSHENKQFLIREMYRRDDSIVFEQAKMSVREFKVTFDLININDYI